MEYSRKDYDELTEDDNELLLSLVAKIAIRLHQIYDDHKSPKELAKVWLKKLKTSKSKAGIFILYRMDLNLTPLSPEDFNKLLADNLMDSSHSKTGDMIADSYNIGAARYLPLNRMSELLTSLEMEGLFSHILGKEKIKQLTGRMAKRDGGPYSLYKLSYNAQEILSVLSNPKAVQKIITGLDNSNILYKALKYVTMTFFYILRDVKHEELFDAFLSTIKEDKKKISTVTADLIAQKIRLAKFTDVQLERYAERVLGLNLKNILRDETNFLARVFLLLAAVRP